MLTNIWRRIGFNFLAFNLEFHFPSGKNAPRGCGEDDEALQVPMQIHWCYHFTTALWDYTIMAHGMILRCSSLQHLSERSEPNQHFMLKFDIWLHIQMDVPCKPQIWSSVWGSTLRVAMLLWVASQAYCWVLQGTLPVTPTCRRFVTPKMVQLVNPSLNPFNQKGRI